jgi:hypothetical protein
MKVTLLLKKNLHNNFSQFPNLTVNFFTPKVGLEPKTLAKHRALTHDFTQLFLEMEREGLFQPSYFRIACRMFEILAFWVIGFYITLLPECSIWLKMIGCAAGAMGSGRAGWLMHEGGHHSLTGKPKLDKYIQSVFIGTL